MKRSELEHLIRAAGRIAGDPEIVVIGSQAILGQFPDAPPVPGVTRIWISRANWHDTF
ncbi:MAG: hypothetical protein ACT4PS_16750 [Betaproteobacteria bacterium]